jgi:hypothetical protein
MRSIGIVIGILGSLIVACQTTPDKPVIGGVFVGYTYSEQPVVHEEVDMGYGYTLKFWAYDLGGEVRFVAYAHRKQTGDYYNGMMRFNIQDPNGNAFTFYRNNDAEAVDAPIVWTPHALGAHKITIEMDLLPPNKASISFDVSLVRQPISLALIGGIAAFVAIVILSIVYTLQRRRRGA